MLLILVIQAAFLIHTVGSWHVQRDSKETGTPINTNMMHESYSFGNDKLKNVLKRLFRENKEPYLKTAGDEVSMKIRKGIFLHFMKGTTIGLKGKYILEPDEEDEKEFVSNIVGQNLDIKWFNRMN